MVVPVQSEPISLTADALRTQIKRLNSKAGQMKMDLHDLAEGLPTDYQNLMEVAAQTYEIFRQIDDLKQQLTTLERGT
ncbi:MAG: CCE_0567 family metalloprotein [Thermosynechococcaceae cyanobacterium]